MSLSATIIAILLLLTGGAVLAALRVARRKNIDIILRSRRRAEPHSGTRHIFLCVADHFEPYWHNTDDDVARTRVANWHERYPALMDDLRDNGGRCPRHIFFYPAEEYRPWLLDPLADLTRRGYGDVEVHLHHDNDTAASLRASIEEFKGQLREGHGLLHSGADGTPGYAFIHGNWTLDNSDPQGRFCGVNDELTVLRDSGCYADFTYPSAPHPTQPPLINRIYYATDDPRRPRSHHTGTDARHGVAGQGDLLMFTGPLALNWRRRRRGLLPAVENGDLTGINPPTPDRIDLWVNTGIGVAGWPGWIFIKAYTHGAQESNSARLLSEGPGGLRWMYQYFLDHYNDGDRYVTHFSTPWEMYRAVKTLESGDDDAIRALQQFALGA